LMHALQESVRARGGIHAPQATLKEAELLELEIKLTARPRIGGGVRDLLRRQLPRGPVRRLRALRNAQAEEQRRQRAHAGLLEPVTPRERAEVDDRRRREREHLA